MLRYNLEVPLIDVERLLDEVHDGLAHDDAPHGAEATWALENCIFVSVFVDAVSGIDLTVFEEADEAAGWTERDAVTFDLLAQSAPIPVWRCGKVAASNVANMLALSCHDGEAIVPSVWMNEVSNVILGIDEECVSFLRLPLQESNALEEYGGARCSKGGSEYKGRNNQ